MKNFTKKKLKKTMDTTYTWVDKTNLNELPDTPLENKVTAEDMNYLNSFNAPFTDFPKSYVLLKDVAPFIAKKLNISNTKVCRIIVDHFEDNAGIPFINCTMAGDHFTVYMCSGGTISSPTWNGVTIRPKTYIGKILTLELFDWETTI